MLADTLHILKERLLETALFGDVYAIADTVREFKNGTPKTYPAYWDGKEYKKLEYDKLGSMAYFRRNGKASLSRFFGEASQTTSCAPKNQVWYTIQNPVKLICFIPKSKAGCNDGFEDDALATRLISVLTDTGLRRLIANTISVEVIASGYNTDNISVLRDEYSNANEINDINYEYAYFSIDLNINAVVNSECLNTCEAYGY